MADILDIVVKILAALLTMGITYVLTKVKKFLESRMSETDMDMLENLISSFCQAAEQQFKEDDPTGEKRLEYVKEQLVKLGYEITDLIQAEIESAVWKINLTSK